MSAIDKDAALVADIRLLGRILGDTLKLHEGEATYELIETIRKLAVASRRLEDVTSRRSLAETLDALADDQAVMVVRAFSYFSLLANIAEDRHHVRRHRENRRHGSPPLASTLRGLFADAVARGTTRAEGVATLARVRVTPVLTAHPTEVQRKSTLDIQLAIAEWLGKLDNADLLDEERAAVEAEMRRLVATLWQTRMLRAVKLGVKDEIENALAYFDYSFIDAIPRIHGEIEDSVASLPGEIANTPLPTVMSIGSWVGGDRDGNPFVTAEMLEHAFRRQAEIAFDHYFAEVHALGAELAASPGLWAHLTPAMKALADLSPDRSPFRQDEPYRRALTGVFARLAATASALGIEARAPHRRGQGRAVCRSRGVRDRPRRDRHEPALGQLIPARRRQAAPPAPRGAHLRLPPRDRGPAPERGRARAGDRGAVPRGARGTRLPRAGRAGAAGARCGPSWPRRGRCARRSPRIPSC